LSSSGSSFSFAHQSFGDVHRKLGNSSPCHYIPAVILWLEVRGEACVELGIGAIDGWFEEDFLQICQYNESKLWQSAANHDNGPNDSHVSLQFSSHQARMHALRLYQHVTRAF
jgi:hypothetical protein